MNPPHNEIGSAAPTHQETSDVRMTRRVLIGASVGTSLEWFDFLLYGALSGIVFPAVFFPESSPAIGVIQSFATFGVGFAARPIGAAFFSRISDRAGRKRTMVITLTLMGLASLAIGCLPGYHTIGTLAPTLLVSLRFLQGFSVGGEASSAQIMAMEFAPDNRRGLFGAFVNMGNPTGQVIVATLLLTAGFTLGDEALTAWAWRIPFVVGALMAVVGYFIRRHLDESPAFVEAREIGARSTSPLRDVFKGHWRTILKLAAIWAPNTACSFLVSTYSLAYIRNELHMSTRVSFGLLLAVNLVGVALMPVGGLLSDRFGRKPVLLTCMTISAAGLLLLFPLLDTKHIILMFFGMAIPQGAQLMAVGTMAALFAEPFPVNVRYSGHAAIYTLNNLVAGGPAPFVAALLLSLTGTTWSMIVLLGAMYLVSLTLLKTLAKETRWDEFRTNFE